MQAVTVKVEFDHEISVNVEGSIIIDVLGRFNGELVVSQISTQVLTSGEVLDQCHEELSTVDDKNLKEALNKWMAFKAEHQFLIQEISDAIAHATRND